MNAISPRSLNQFRKVAMNENSPRTEASVYEQRDHWKAQAQEAWQRVAELELALKGVVPKGWLKDDTMDHMPGIKFAREVLARVKK